MAQGVTVLCADANDSLLCVTCSHSVNAVNILLALLVLYSTLCMSLKLILFTLFLFDSV